MSVPEQVPYKEYRATGSNNSFEITFYLPDPKDLVVMVNKEIPLVGAYSVQGNTVVFSTPPKEGDLIELTRDTQLDRETNFKSYDNSFRPETINFDLDKIWLVLQESNLVDAKILARLKQEIEWRRTHDFNYDELAQVREKQLFDALKGYTDTLNAATNPGVFQGVIAGVVFAIDGKSVQTHIEEILNNLTTSRKDIDSKADQDYVDEQLNLKAPLTATNELQEKKADLDYVNSIVSAASEGTIPFQTEAELILATPVQNKVLAKALDTRKEWLWTRTSAEGVTPITGEWTDTGLSDLDQAKDYTDQESEIAKELAIEKSQENKQLIELIAQEVLKKILNGTDNNILNVVDRLENIVFKIDKDGKIYAVGMESDLVTAIASNKSLVQQLSNDVTNQVLTKLFSSTTGNIIDLVDAVENIVFQIKADGKIHLVGLDTDLVTAINSKSETGIAIVDTSNLANYSYKDTFEQPAQTLLNFAHSQSVGLYAPAPLGQFKQNFTLSNTWLDQAVISEFPSITPMNTPYGTNRGVVHPHILEFPNGFNGYRYLLGMTGYTNGNTREENPFIYGSNDLQSFDLLTDVLDTPESFKWEKGITYNSDIVMFYDPKTLELCVSWRRYLADTSGGTPNETSETIYCIRTKDLKTWSEKEVIFYRDANTLPNEVPSPVFLFDVKNDTWHMYAPSGTRAVNSIRHFTAKKLHRDAWTLQGTITALPVGSLPWHLDGRFIGDRVALLVQDREPGTSRGVGMRLGISDPDSYTDFTWASKYMDDVPNRLECYKGTFVPHFNELNQMSMTYIWTTNSNETEKYKLLIKTTPFFDAGVTVK